MGCKQPSALFDLSSPSHKSGLDNHSDSFLLVELSDLNRCWVSLSAVMSPSFPTATRPNPPTHTVSFPARLLHGPRTFSSSVCHIRLHICLLFYCGLKSPGINSTLSPGSLRLGRSCCACFMFCLLHTDWSNPKGSSVELHMWLCAEYKMSWIRKHLPHLFFVWCNENLHRNYEWSRMKQWSTLFLQE